MKTIQHEFVDFIPEKISEGKLYVSLKYNTVIHLCACGCGREVSTPIAPNEWKMNYDGVSVSLTPSIGNWGFPCKSHYWIKNGQIKWAEPASEFFSKSNKKLSKKISWFKKLFF